jgi:tRNA(adenine34) deaminase
MNNDKEYMLLALEQGRLASEAGEVPVGAIVVKNGVVIGLGRNTPVSDKDPSAHAEIQALRSAALAIGNYRLDGCELFVTLEPCSMCAGAMMHARLRRVVFGAWDAKTGVAGSVLNLFENKQLNHQTSVTGGVLSTECGALLQNFFASLRKEKFSTAIRLPESALRTPAVRFNEISDFPWTPNYNNQFPALRGMRLHFLDEGKRDAQKVFLCLHGVPSWSYIFRNWVSALSAAGHRVVVPDMLGFGKSDKPKKWDTHTLAFHRAYLLELIADLDLRNIVLIGLDWGLTIGVTLMMDMPSRFVGLLAMNGILPWHQTTHADGLPKWKWRKDNPVSSDVCIAVPEISVAEARAYDMPFVDAGHCAALLMTPTWVTDDFSVVRRTQAFLAEQWLGKTMILWGEHHARHGAEALKQVISALPNGSYVITLPCSGDWVPEMSTERIPDVLTHFAPDN